MCQRAKGTMRRGVAVAADHRHAGQGPALLGADDMHDALTDIADRVVMDAEIARVLVERCHLDAAFLGHLVGVFAARRGGHVVVGHGDGFLGRADLTAGHAQPLKGLRACDLMHEVAVDIEQAGAILGLMGEMGIPDLVVECLAGHRVSILGSGNIGGRRRIRRSKPAQPRPARTVKAPWHARPIRYVEKPGHRILIYWAARPLARARS